MTPDDEVCLCFHVTRRKLESFVRIERPVRVSQMSHCGGAGTGCGWCVPLLEKLFQSSCDSIDLPDADEWSNARQSYLDERDAH